MPGPPSYPLRFVYKWCISLTKLAFHLQTVHLKLQTCVLLTIVALRFTNAMFRFTIKLLYHIFGGFSIGIKAYALFLHKNLKLYLEMHYFRHQYVHQYVSILSLVSLVLLCCCAVVPVALAY